MPDPDVRAGPSVFQQLIGGGEEKVDDVILDEATGSPSLSQSAIMLGLAARIQALEGAFQRQRLDAIAAGRGEAEAEAEAAAIQERINRVAPGVLQSLQAVRSLAAGLLAWYNERFTPLSGDPGLEELTQQANAIIAQVDAAEKSMSQL